MRVAVVRGGGLAGLVTSTEVDTADLAAADAATLRAVADRALAAGRPAPPARPVAPDRFQYTVSVEDGGRTETLSFGEPGIPENVRELIALVEVSPARRRRTAPPG